MVRAAIVGCGSIARLRHAPEYKNNENAVIAGFFDVDRKRAAEMSNSFGGRVYNNVEDILNDSLVDAVSISAANSVHSLYAIASLRAGKHVLCEKPMATTLEDCDAMIEASVAADRILMIGHNQRFVPAHIKAKEIIDSEIIGNVISFRTVFSHKGPETWAIDKSRGTWFFKKEIAGMGVTADLGIHKVDLLRWLINDDFVEINASISTLDKKYSDGTAIQVKDNAFCILKSVRGIMGTMTASWTNYGEEENSTVIYCTGGTIELFCDNDHQICVRTKEGNCSYFDSENIQTNDRQTNSGVIDSFIGSIEKGTQPEVSGYDGRESVRVILACCESAARRSVVRL